MTSVLASDLIIDVIQAADPATVKLRAQKLQSTTTQSENFDFVLNYKTRISSPSVTNVLYSLESGGEKKIAMQFEALFLKTFIEAMLPKSTDVFSQEKGFAFETWKSMLADELAKELSKKDTLRISDMIRESFTKKSQQL